MLFVPEVVDRNSSILVVVILTLNSSKAYFVLCEQWLFKLCQQIVHFGKKIKIANI